MRRTLRLCLALAAMGLVTSLTVWSAVPNPMPIHWNAAGQADGYAPRAVGLLMLPAMAIALPAIVTLAAKLDKHARNSKALHVINVGLAAFLLGVHALTIQASLRAGHHLSMQLLFAMLGTLFVGLGWVMPMLKQNKIAGIRTPWTLSSKTNWTLTHRAARWTMGIGGMVCILAALALSPPALVWVGFSAIMAGALSPIAVSYMIHRARA